MVSMGTKVEKKRYGDSKSALTLCSGETGHGRTRHLRVRATKLREAVRCLKEWEVAHKDVTEVPVGGLQTTSTPTSTATSSSPSAATGSGMPGGRGLGEGWKPS